MRVRATVRQMKERFEDYLQKVVEDGTPCFVRDKGKDCAVLVSLRDWDRREFGRQLDALGEEYRVSPKQQKRAEKLLAEQGRRELTAEERRELRQLGKEFDKVMLRRSKAMERLRTDL